MLAARSQTVMQDYFFCAFGCLKQPWALSTVALPLVLGHMHCGIVSLDAVVTCIQRLQREHAMDTFGGLTGTKQ